MWAQASLPVSYDDNVANLPKGFSQSGLVDYTNSPKLKFDTEGDYLLLHIDSDPGEFSCLLK